MPPIPTKTPTLAAAAEKRKQNQLNNFPAPNNIQASQSTGALLNNSNTNIKDIDPTNNKNNRLKLPIYEKSKSNFRWLVLFLSCFAMFGSYYCYDNPTALNTQIQDNYNLSNIQYNLLYTVYSIPNTVLPLFGGALVDRIGADKSLVLFLSLCTLGQAIFAFGASLSSFPLMLVGRTFFGFGGESVTVAQSAYLGLYFAGKEVALAMGLNLSLARGGSSLNDFLSLAVYNKKNSVPAALWVGFVILIVCLCLTTLMVFLDRGMAKRMEKKGYYVPPIVSGEVVKLSDVKNFGIMYWLLTTSCLVVYGCVLPWNNIGASLMQDEYNLSNSKANSFLAIPYITSAILTPPCGYLVDLIGHRCELLLISATALCTAHYFFAFWDSIYPLTNLILLGVGYSLYAAVIWPSIARVVNPNILGTAYGVVTAIQNIGLALFPIIVASLTGSTDDSNKYHKVEVFFFCLGYFGVMVGMTILILDNRWDNLLLDPSMKKNDNNDNMKKSLLNNDDNNEIDKKIKIVNNNNNINDNDNSNLSLQETPQFTSDQHKKGLLDSTPVMLNKQKDNN